MKDSGWLRRVGLVLVVSLAVSPMVWILSSSRFSEGVEEARIDDKYHEHRGNQGDSRLRVHLQDANSTGFTDPSISQAFLGASTFDVFNSSEEAGCVPAEADVRQPNIPFFRGELLFNDTTLGRFAPLICKLLVEFTDPETGETVLKTCSGTLINEHQLLTARHCTYDGCLQTATNVRVACNYRWTPAFDDYARAGTAKMSTSNCLLQGDYDSTAGCDANGRTILGDAGFDIQVCSLDRRSPLLPPPARLLVRAPLTGTSSAQIWGFPGMRELEQLSSFGDSATDALVLLAQRSSALANNTLFFDPSWAYPGMDGGPITAAITVNGNRLFAFNGVVSGGATSCAQRVAAVSPEMEDQLRNPSSTQRPPEHCQIMEYRHDFLNAFTHPLKRVGKIPFSVDGNGPPASGSSSIQVTSEEEEIFGSLVLRNVGVTGGTTTTRWYASEDDTITTGDIFLGEGELIPQIQPGDVVPVDSATENGFKASWAGLRYIGVIWSAVNRQNSSIDCKLDDGDRTVVGRVTTGCRCVDPLGGTGAVTCFNETRSCEASEECYSNDFALYGDWSAICRPKTRVTASISMGPHTRTFEDRPRGYTFQAPCNMAITSAYVHGSLNSRQSLQIVVSDTEFRESTDFTLNPKVVFESYEQVRGENWIPVNTMIPRGQYVGVLGYRGNNGRIINSYGLADDAIAEICGAPVTVNRFLSQETRPPFTRFSQQSSGQSISRVSLNASRATPLPTPAPTPPPTFLNLTARACEEGRDYFTANGTYTTNGTYGNLINCYFTIQAAQIRFTRMDLEWNYDYLYVLTGPGTPSTSFNGVEFARDDANLTLTGNAVPPLVNSSSGVFSFLFSTDAEVVKTGWEFEVVREVPANTPTPAPVTVAPVTTSPSISLSQLTAAEYQLGGGQDYNGSIPNLVLADNTLNSIVGSRSMVLTCFSDADGIDNTTGFFPWLSTSLGGSVASSTGGIGFELMIENVTMDFDSRGQCGPFRVRKLTIRNAVIREMFNGFLLAADGSEIVLDSVIITSTQRTTRRARHLVKATGMGSHVLIRNSEIENYAPMEGGIVVDSPGAASVEVTGSRIRELSGSSSPFENGSPPEGLGQNCSCNDPCFENENYCTASPSRWAFHAAAFISVRVSALSSSTVRVIDSQFLLMQGFVQAVVSSVETTGSCISGASNCGNVSVIHRGTVVTLSGGGDLSLRLRTDPPTTTVAPTLGPTTVKPPRDPTMAPTAMATISPTPFATTGQVPFTAGVAAVKGFVNRVVFDSVRFENNIQTEIRSDVRRSVLSVDTMTETLVSVSNVRVAEAVLDAVVYDSGNDFSRNTHSLENTTVQEIQALIDAKGRRTQHQAVVFTENVPPFSVTIKGLDIRQSPMGALYSFSPSFSRSADEPPLRAEVSLERVTASDVELFFKPASSSSPELYASGMVALAILGPHGDCAVTVTDSDFSEVGFGVGLFDVNCRNTSLKLNNVAVANTLDLANTGTPSVILTSPSTEISRISVDQVNMTSGNTGFARIRRADDFEMNITASRFHNISKEILRVSDTIGHLRISGSEFTESTTPAINIQSDRDVESRNTQFITLRDLVFRRNIGVKQGAIQIDTANGALTAERCAFFDNIAISDNDEDSLAAGGSLISRGGAIASEGRVVASDCRFVNNTAFFGGAIFAASVSTTACNFTGNAAKGRGGDIVTAQLRMDKAIVRDSSAGTRGGSMWLTRDISESGSIAKTRATILSSLFFDTRAQEGGLLFCDANFAITVRDVVIDGVTSSTGAFYVDEFSTITIERAIIRNLRTVDASFLYISASADVNLTSVTANRFRATGFGGIAVVERGGVLLIRDSLFNDVISQASGGGLYMRRDSSATITNTALTNFSAVNGGLAFILGGRLSVKNATLSGFFAETGGLVDALTGARLIVSQSTITDCTAQTAAFASLSKNSVTVIDGDTVFRRLRARQTSSFAWMTDSASLTVTDTTIQQSLASQVGLIQLLINSRLRFRRVTVIGIESMLGGGSGVTLRGQSSFDAQNCTFALNINRDDSAAPGGFVSVHVRASANLEQVVFRENQGSYGSAVAVTASGSLNVKNCSFVGNTGGSGPAIYIATKGLVSVKSSTFFANGATRFPGDGGAIVAESSQMMELTNNIFANNTAQRSGGAVRVGTQAKMVVEGCRFSRNHASFKGGAMSVVNASVNTSFVLFHDNMAWKFGGAVSLDGSRRFVTKNTNFTMNIVSPQPNAIAEATKGGAIHVSDSTDETDVIFREGTMFIRNQATGGLGAGGAIYWDRDESRPFGANFGGSGVRLLDNEQVEADEGVPDTQVAWPLFIGNTADQGEERATAPHFIEWDFGGTTGRNLTVEPQTQVSDTIEVRIRDFYNNSVVEPVRLDLHINADPDVASVQGGTLIATNGVGCFGDQCPSITITRVVSSPDTQFTFKVIATASITRDDGTQLIYTLNTTEATLVVLPCPPGTILNSTQIPFRCVDCPAGTFQPDLPDESTECRLCGTGNFSSEPRSVQCKICEGFTGVTNGSTKCTPCNDDEIPRADGLGCESCPEGAVRGRRFWQCVCNAGRFSYYPEDFEGGSPTVCRNCPDGGRCEDPGMVAGEVDPDKGFWYDTWRGEDDVTFIECVNNACPGQERGECESGYHGILCTECTDGYGRSRRHYCEECQGGLGLVIFKIVGSWLLVCIVALLLTYVNVVEAEKDIAQAAQIERGELVRSSEASTLFRILLNFFQFNSVAADFDFEWPNFIRNMLEGQGLVGLSASALLKLDCAHSGGEVQPFYMNTLVIALLPFIVPLLSLIMVAIFSCRNKQAIASRDGNPSTGDEEHKFDYDPSRVPSHVTAVPGVGPTQENQRLQPAKSTDSKSISTNYNTLGSINSANRYRFSFSESRPVAPTQIGRSSAAPRPAPAPAGGGQGVAAGAKQPAVLIRIETAETADSAPGGESPHRPPHHVRQSTDNDVQTTDTLPSSARVPEEKGGSASTRMSRRGSRRGSPGNSRRGSHVALVGRDVQMPGRLRAKSLPPSINGAEEVKRDEAKSGRAEKDAAGAVAEKKDDAVAEKESLAGGEPTEGATDRENEEEAETREPRVKSLLTVDTSAMLVSGTQQGLQHTESIGRGSGRSPTVADTQSKGGPDVGAKKKLKWRLSECNSEQKGRRSEYERTGSTEATMSRILSDPRRSPHFRARVSRNISISKNERMYGTHGRESMLSRVAEGKDEKECKKLKKKHSLAQFYASNLSLMFMLWPSLVKASFRILDCEKLSNDPDSYRLVEDMSQVCFQAPHLIYFIALGLPMLVFYVAGFPMYLLRLLLKYRDDMPARWAYRADTMTADERFRSERHSMSIHLIYDGYRPFYYCFELVVMLRKIFVMAISVFVRNSEAQAQLIILLVVFCIMIQNNLNPFEGSLSNKFEFAALFTSFCTFFFGSLLFFSPEPIKIFASLVVILANVIFFVAAVYIIIRTVIKEFRQELKNTPKQDTARPKKGIFHRFAFYISNMT